MRHAKKRSRINRTRGEMRSLVMNQCRSIFEYQRIITTYAKAKVVRPVAEKIISLAKADNLSNKRKVFAILNDHALVKHIFEKIAPLFKDSHGGYTRIIKYKNRRGDNALLVIFELTKKLVEDKPAPKEKKEKKPKTATEPVSEAGKHEEAEIHKPGAQEKKKHEHEKPATYKEEKHPEKKFKPPVKDIEKDKHEQKGDKFLGGIGKMFRRKQEP